MGREGIGASVNLGNVWKSQQIPSKTLQQRPPIFFVTKATTEQIQCQNDRNAPLKSEIGLPE